MTGPRSRRCAVAQARRLIPWPFQLSGQCLEPDVKAANSPSVPWVPGDAPIAVIMLTLNEAHNMEAVLNNLQGWAQEVFLVDSYSRDHTVDIALNRGVHVIQRSFRGFGDQWNFALRELPITAPWTMKLDPDERLSDRLKAGLNAAVSQNKADGLSIDRRLWFMGRRLPVRQRLLRVWRTGNCSFTDVAVNEYPEVTGTAAHVEGELEHHDSPNLEHWLNKQNKYTTAEALSAFEDRALAATPRLFGSNLERRMWLKRHYQQMPLRYTAIFLYHYLVLGAWRAGKVGWMWSHLRTEVYRLIAYKLRELKDGGVSMSSAHTECGRPDPRVTQYL
jgi:glycosyltransferase involved in cell wall biosynthesis